MIEDREKPAEIRRVGVVGLGLLGRGIAACLLTGGYDVVAYDRDLKIQPDFFSYLQEVVGEIAEHRSDARCADWQERLHWAADLNEFGACDLIIESVSESLPVKRELLKELEGIVGAEIPLASNTSALPVTDLQRGLAHPERVAGMHWAEPAFATRFLELIGGAQTSTAVLQQLNSFGKSLGKEPSIVNDLPGFIVNRLGYAMYREAMNLLDSGVADAATIDRAYRNAAGLWASFCGPFRWIDITGGAALYARAMEGVLPSLASSENVPAVLQRQVLADSEAIATQGERAATGFYRETAEQKRAWLKLLHRQAWEIEALRSRIDEEMVRAGVKRESREANG